MCLLSHTSINIFQPIIHLPVSAIRHVTYHYFFYIRINFTLAFLEHVFFSKLSNSRAIWNIIKQNTLPGLERVIELINYRRFKSLKQSIQSEKDTYVVKDKLTYILTVLFLLGKIKSSPSKIANSLKKLRILAQFLETIT